MVSQDWDARERSLMPINKYYSGHGTEVMSDMVKRYGPQKGKEVFYATMNKRKKKRVASSVGRMLRKKG